MAQNDYITSANGRKLITEFEGELLRVYLDPVGLPTLGVGHLLTAAEKKRMPVGTKISKAESQAYLAKDLEEHEAAVRAAVKVPITQNQFDALVSFSFNVGKSGMKGSSVLRNLNARHFTKAADSFLLWNKAGGKVLAGLTRRRKAERELFLTPDKQNSAAKQTELSPEQVNVTTDDPQIPTIPSPDAEPPKLESDTSGAFTLPSMDTVTQQIPRITTARNWLGTLGLGGIASTTYAVFNGWPPWAVFTLGFLTGVVLTGLTVLFIKYYGWVFDLVGKVAHINASPNVNNIALVSRREVQK